MVAKIYPTTIENKRFYHSKLKPLALRMQLNNPNFMPSVSTVLNKIENNRYSYIVKTDITNFFESIPRKELLKASEEISAMIDVPSSEIASTCFKKDGRNIFLPVGYSTSPFIAEYIITKYLKDVKDLSTMRYVDDILITIYQKAIFDAVLSNPETLVKSILFKDEAHEWIKLSKEKTAAIDLRNPLVNNIQFLGANFNLSGGQINFVSVYSNKSMKKYNYIFNYIGKTIAQQRLISNALYAHSNPTSNGIIETRKNGDGSANIWDVISVLECDPETGCSLKRMDRKITTWVKGNMPVEDYSLYCGFINNKYKYARNYAMKTINYFYNKEMKKLLLDLYGIDSGSLNFESYVNQEVAL